jgi:hypothetical protein
MLAGGFNKKAARPKPRGLKESLIRIRTGI